MALAKPETWGASIKSDGAKALVDIPVAELLLATFVCPTFVLDTGGVRLAVEAAQPVENTELGLSVVNCITLLKSNRHRRRKSQVRSERCEARLLRPRYESCTPD